MTDKKINRQQMVFAVVFIFGFAVLLRLTVGMSFINTADTFWYRDWATALPDGFFDIYTRAESIRLDYPPLYLYPLYLVGLVYKALGDNPNIYLQMLLLKFFPLLFDMLCGVFLYRKFREYGFASAVLASVFWLLNPSMFFNSACWGQTDSVMAFLLIVSFWYLQKDRPVLSAVLFALAGLTKYQSLMFTPVFLLQLYFNNRKKWLTIAKSLGAAALTVVAVFLPFMIGSKNPMLFFDVYLGGADTYPYCSLFCFNFYGMVGLDWTSGINDTRPVFGPLSAQNFGYIMLALTLAVLVFMYIKGRRRSPWVAGLFIMQCIFMFVTRMHERYQIIVLPFALLSYLVTKRTGFGISYLLLSLMTLLNQVFVLLFYVNGNAPVFWENYITEVIAVLSVLNFILFIYTIIICVRYFVCKDKKRTAEIPVDRIDSETNKEASE